MRLGLPLITFVVLQADHGSAVAAHGESGDGAGARQGNGAEIGIGEGDEVLGDEVFVFIVGRGGAVDVPGAAAVRHDDDQWIFRRVAGSVGHVGPGLVIVAEAVEQVEHWVAAGGSFVIDREDDVGVAFRAEGFTLDFYLDYVFGDGAGFDFGGGRKRGGREGQESDCVTHGSD